MTKPTYIIMLVVLSCTGITFDATGQDSTRIFNKAERTDSLLQAIDELHDKAATIEHISEEGFNLKSIKSGLPRIQQDVKLLQVNLRASAGVMDIKSLQTFSLLLDRAQKQLSGWRKELLDYSQQLVGTQTEIESLHHSALLKAFQSDSLFVQLYNNELKSIQASWDKAQQLNSKNLKEISLLQTQVSNYYFITRDLHKELRTQVAHYSGRVFGNEYPYIWQSYHHNLDQNAVRFLETSYTTQKQLITDYLWEHLAFHTFLATAIFFLFVWWVRRNYNRLVKAGKAEDWPNFSKGGYLSKFPWLSGLIIVLNLAPFFSFNPPAAYISLMQILLFIVVTIFIMRRWPKPERKNWLFIGIGFVVFLFANNVFNPGIGVRCLLIALNIFFVYKALLFVKTFAIEISLIRHVKAVASVLLVLNLLAVLLNIAGRVTLAKMLGNAGISGFIQIVSLSLFSNILEMAFILQTHTASVVNHGTAIFNYDKLSKSVNRALSVIVFMLWLVVFASNMNVLNIFVEGMVNFLFTPRTVGSTTFTIGNILLFFLVLYLSALIQRYVGFILGEHYRSDVPGSRKGTRVVIVKLLVIVVGFLIAILVSGLPLDKVTVILSAFGVGIGLGLQTIVNNLVSGIILIFERPLQIGDYVEVAGYKGWVNDIGIRATTLSSSEGAEIVVPNGTILSGNLVNWTLSNSEIRTEILLKFTPANQIELAGKIICDVITSGSNVVSSRNPEIFNESLNGDVAELKVWFWIDNIARQETVRSNIITRMYTEFSAHGIKLM